MVTRYWAYVSLLSALALGGCATDFGPSVPMLQTGGQSFSSGLSSASKLLTSEVSAAPDVERRLWAFSHLPAAEQAQALADGNFASFACVGLDKGGDASNALNSMSEVSKSVDAMTAKPASKLSDVLASIKKYETPQDKTVAPFVAKAPGNGANLQQTVCNNHVGDAEKVLKALNPSSGQAQGAQPHVFGVDDLVAAASALQALYAAAKTVVLDGAQSEDQAVREKALKQFLSLPSTDDVMTKALGQCAHYDPVTSVKPDGSLADVPACTGGPLSKGGDIDTLFGRRVASTLVVPIVQFHDAMTATGLTPHDLVEKLETVRTNLADFDAVRTQNAPGDLATPIAKAYLDLRRLADDKLTDKEKKQAITDDLNAFESLVDQLSKDVTTLQTKATAAKTAVDKL